MASKSLDRSTERRGKRPGRDALNRLSYWHPKSQLIVALVTVGWAGSTQLTCKRFNDSLLRLNQVSFKIARFWYNCMLKCITSFILIQQEYLDITHVHAYATATLESYQHTKHSNTFLPLSKSKVPPPPSSLRPPSSLLRMPSLSSLPSPSLNLLNNSFSHSPPFNQHPEIETTTSNNTDQ